MSVTSEFLPSVSTLVRPELPTSAPPAPVPDLEPAPPTPLEYVALCVVVLAVVLAVAVVVSAGAALLGYADLAWAAVYTAVTASVAMLGLGLPVRLRG